MHSGILFTCSSHLNLRVFTFWMKLLWSQLYFKSFIFSLQTFSSVSVPPNKFLNIFLSHTEASFDFNNFFVNLVALLPLFTIFFGNTAFACIFDIFKLLAFFYLDLCWLCCFLCLVLLFSS